MDQCDANSVTALYLHFADELGDAVAAFAPRSEPAQSIAFIGRAPSLTIRKLSGLLGLSHAATVRLVDRLHADGLVDRNPSKEDGRAVCLTLTPLGQERYDKMLGARRHVVDRTLSGLTDEDREVFVQLARKILASSNYTETTAARGCRFCDVQACDSCPVTTAS